MVVIVLSADVAGAACTMEIRPRVAATVSFANPRSMGMLLKLPGETGFPPDILLLLDPL
ncbi:hypothetical protein [Mesorhizobium abyssinicae]